MLRERLRFLYQFIYKKKFRYKKLWKSQYILTDKLKKQCMLIRLFKKITII